jgi:hypothetical protein
MHVSEISEACDSLKHLPKRVKNITEDWYLMHWKSIVPKNPDPGESAVTAAGEEASLLGFRERGK